jgi:hypothetical protein
LRKGCPRLSGERMTRLLHPSPTSSGPAGEGSAASAVLFVFQCDGCTTRPSRWRARRRDDDRRQPDELSGPVTSSAVVVHPSRSASSRNTHRVPAGMHAEEPKLVAGRVSVHASRNRRAPLRARTPSSPGPARLQRVRSSSFRMAKFCVCALRESATRAPLHRRRPRHQAPQVGNRRSPKSSRARAVRTHRTRPGERCRPPTGGPPEC